MRRRRIGTLGLALGRDRVKAAAGGAFPTGGLLTSGAVADAQHAEKKNRKRTLATLALRVAAIGTAVGSGADFTARTANPSNTFSAGSLTMENSKNGTAILSATNMKPGGAAQTGIVDIKNTGSIEGVFKLSRDQVTSTDANNDNPAPFASKVVMAIVDCGKFTIVNGPYGPDPVTPTCGDQDDATLYLGTLQNENSDVALGTYHPGEQHRYRFEASLASAAGNEYQGDGATARYVFDATQTP